MLGVVIICCVCFVPKPMIRKPVEFAENLLPLCLSYLTKEIFLFYLLYFKSTNLSDIPLGLRSEPSILVLDKRVEEQVGHQLLEEEEELR